MERSPSGVGSALDRDRRRGSVLHPQPTRAVPRPARGDGSMRAGRDASRRPSRRSRGARPVMPKACRHDAAHRGSATSGTVVAVRGDRGGVEHGRDAPASRHRQWKCEHDRHPLRQQQNGRRRRSLRRARPRSKRAARGCRRSRPPPRRPPACSLSPGVVGTGLPQGRRPRVPPCRSRGRPPRLPRRAGPTTPPPTTPPPLPCDR